MAGLPDNFMPGETYGMPNAQPRSRMSGLLDDPLFQFGLGVLGNSQGNDFSTALGRGGLQASQNLQYQRQLSQQRQMQDLQMQESQNKIEQNKRMQEAIARATQNNPQLADAFQINPNAALKMAYPELAKNAADPYYTTITTNAGLGKFNSRDGSFELITTPEGTPYIKSTDDPVTQGKVSAAKAYGTGLFKPNTDVDGVVSTDAQVALSANPMLSGMDFLGGINPSIPMKQSPQPAMPKTPTNMPRVSPQEQSMRDNKRLQILLDEQKRQGGAGVDPQLDAEISSVGSGRIPMTPSFGGIRVPTKAQEAGAVQTAKNASDLVYTPQIEGAKKTAGMTAEATTQAALDLPQNVAQAQETVKLVDDLINHPGFKKSVGLNSYNPLNKVAGTEAKDFNNRLDQLKGKQFLQAFQTLKGGGQITEVEGKKATDAIARMNTSSSEAEFKKAAQDFKSVIDAGIKRAKERAGVSPSSGGESNNANVFDSMPKPSQYKGKIIRDDVTGKRYQSNGLQWKEVK